MVYKKGEKPDQDKTKWEVYRAYIVTGGIILFFILLSVFN